ncbi:Crp/Fnr family transcriptional regulator [Devosia sp. 63-57]|nr:Crp/Fnr family transcriptional regulator [Devosia sp. 63-57]ODT50803.1 MAG: Crp/Fnr family transcriptional regulator [Pelagibacterium sp. SCN 63-126]ODU82419.1 MAG: Crp/Fnr family transcriptional regulator [Pelagibacterium sp. SCN 63-17]OJX44535.1 MAG: Crp/Fnr family transcriptional regulator [Devosia sp. 63-57]
MSLDLPIAGRRVPCEQCPLRAMPSFRPFTSEELKFVSSFKSGELVAETGSSILMEGAHSAHLYTVLSGWAFRYKTLVDGRRQILNYLLPGDLVGLQGSVIGEMDHSVEALSPLVLCVFQRDRLDELFRNHPGLGFDVTWLAAREERMLDEHLLSLGRRSALERAAYLLSFLCERAANVGMGGKGTTSLPLSQQHVADTLGLSIVHTNKTLRRLGNMKLIRWHDRSCEVIDVAGLREIAGWEGAGERRRPLI